MIAGAQTTRVTQAKEYHPALWQRIRSVCVWASKDIDLDKHAAGIVEMVVRAQVRAQKGRR